jgi:hypothetical protein
MDRSGQESFGKEAVLLDLDEGDILTKVQRYNLIRSGRMLYIDLHERLAGNLAGRFVAVPNLINLIARPEFQGTGESEEEALQDSLAKIKGVDILDIFPERSAE